MEIKVSIFFIICCLFRAANSLSIIEKRQGESKNIQRLDEDGLITLSWRVDWATETIIFEIEAETKGYVGFGISPSRSMKHGSYYFHGMKGADIFIAGVHSDGTVYSSDRFGTGLEEPKIDEHEDWLLINATEVGAFTYLEFSRPLNSCDDEDYPITNDTSKVIWAIGATDKVEYHSASSRGKKSLHLIDHIPDVDIYEYTSFNITVNVTMPEDETTYWCTFHEGPDLSDSNATHYIVGFEPAVYGISTDYAHHFVISRCHVPIYLDSKDVFEKYTTRKGFKGDLCYKPSVRIPTHYCQEYIYGWAKGGNQKHVFPKHVGYPIGDAGTPYFMVELHLDNPKRLSNINIVAGADIFFTDEPREQEAGVLLIGYNVTSAMTIPPNTKNFVISGHCSPDCTQQLPSEGITVFNSLLHSHISGRKMKVRHWKLDQEEIEWLDFDDHYDSNYQQNKGLPDVKIMPGDQLTLECTYDSTWNNGTIVVGGLSTRNEMCQAYLWYYPKAEFDTCTSGYDIDKGFEDLGIKKYELVEDKDVGWYYIHQPKNLQGNYVDSISSKYNWTAKALERFQTQRRFGKQRACCYNRAEFYSYESLNSNVSYPQNYTEYFPSDVCSERKNKPSHGAKTMLNQICFYLQVTSIFYFGFM